MYFTTNGRIPNNATIMRAKLDGSDPAVIINTGLVEPRGLAIDYAGKFTYGNRQ